ncbi:serine-rich adhesin for platelets [Ischnura elegans]|uniref:serine-rich adhesin for platelets n=1 Tax=Ischnura elegans TaxID=197161 RepID=UPI001ED893D0|nr:serine-rich adhesin for platelets [Ischnura elegans]XP_046399793.1 serine-rich adhesin for platelets [Ischnura elegans]
MKPSFAAAALIGVPLVFLLLPCPGRTADDDLTPPSPPKRAAPHAAPSQTSDTKVADTNDTARTTGALDRPILGINDPPAVAPNCTQLGVCAAPSQGNATAKDASAPAAAGEGQMQPAPLPAESEISGVPAQQGQLPPHLNALEEEASSRPSTSSTTVAALGPSLLGNHVFPTAPEGLGPPRATAKIAAADPDADFVDSAGTSTHGTLVISTPVTSLTSTPMTSSRGSPEKRVTEEAPSTPEKRGKVQKAGVQRKQQQKGRVDKEEETTEGLYYGHFSRMESQDFEEPGTTRSYFMAEQSTRLDYSSSHVVSEVYDSESPAEDEEEGRSEVQEEGKPQDSESNPSAVEEDVSDYMDAEDVETTTALVEGGKDQEEGASSEVAGGRITEAVTTTEETRKGDLIDATGTEMRGNSKDSSSQTDAPTTTTMSTTEVSKGSTQYVGLTSVEGPTSTTTSPRTSRRLVLVQQSTTESPIKNEVTYNETVTGSPYGLKANLSFTTPVVLLLSSTVPSTSSEPSVGTEKAESTSPAASTDQSLTEVLLVSTAATSPTTELSPTPGEQVVKDDDDQGGGNSINDWTTISSVDNEESSTELTTMASSSSSSQAQTDESSTSNTSSSPATSSVLFTTVQNASVSDLVSESMSINSTTEEMTTPTPPTEAETDLSVGNESTSMSTAPPDNDTTIASTDAPSTHVDLGSSTSGELLPEEEKTKVATQGIVDKGEGSDDTKEIVPTTTPIGQNTTVTTELISTTPMTTKPPPPKSTFVPIVVKLNSSSTAEMTDTSYNVSSAIDDGGEKEESVMTYPWHVRLVMEMSWGEMCASQQQTALKRALAQLISSALLTSNAAHSALPTERVLLLNVAERCPSSSEGGSSLSEVHFCILSATNEHHGEEGAATVVHCDASLMQLFLNLWDNAPKPTVEPLVHVKEVGIAHSSHGIPMAPVDDSTGVQAAIGISCVAALALFLLAALLIVMRRRQRRFNYGQRCTPVSLDAYSLDSVSVREARNGDAGSGRRRANGLAKGNDALNDWRASKRSYGNPAFEDDDGEEVLLSKPMNLATLTNAALDDDGALADEFRLIPKRFHKRRTVRRKSRTKNKDAMAERGDEEDGDDGRLPEGAEEKNRYANVVPLPSTRVRLSVKPPGGPLSTYINANFVRGPKNEERFYIACQAPLQSTIEDFWRMVWEQQSKVILMVTNLVENSVEKCADYLPPSEVLDCHRLFGDFQVTLKKRDVKDKYVVSSLQLKNMETNLWREVTHLWFLGWPDQGVPDEPNQIIAFLIEARPLIKANPGPTVVHCSPGTGRTGTVIAIDICIRDFEQSRMIDVPKVVQQMRRDREGCVQTQQQYAFIYKALSLYAAKLTGGAMDSF